jgi:hypothetical protein
VSASGHGSFEALAAFVHVLAEAVQQETVLDELVTQLVSALDVECATVGLNRDGRLWTAAVHPAAAQSLGDLQHDAASPAATAFAENQVLAVADVSRHPDRWPGYCTRAGELGMRSVLSLPLRAAPGMDGVTGAVSLVDADRDWLVDEIALAGTMIDVVAVLVAVGEAGRRDAARVEQLQRALDQRVVVEQAKGMLAAAESISVDQAYARLRAFARSHNAKVGDVAHAVVRLGLRPGPD